MNAVFNTYTGCYHEIGNDRLKETSLHYLSTPWKTKSQESILLKLAFEQYYLTFAY